MFKKFWCTFGGVFSISSLIAIAVAAGTDYWFEIVNIKSNEVQRQSTIQETLIGTLIDVVEANTLQKFPFPYHTGLWVTCYYDNVPDIVPRKDIIRGTCVLDYNFSTYQIEDFSRASIMCITLGGAIVLVACVLCVAGISCQRSGVILHSGILLFTSSLCTLVGLCAFTGRMILQQNEIQVLMTSNTCARFQWSYFVAWGSLGLQIIGGSILVASARSHMNKENLP